MTIYNKLALISFMLLAVPSFSNNVTISNVFLSGQNTIDHTNNINFDISWENSWRLTSGISNWDAVWVFAKFRSSTNPVWKHCTFNWVDGSGTNDGHTFPLSCSINSFNDNGANGSHGAFIFSSNAKVQSTASYSNISLLWKYGVDGLNDNDSVEICVLGIEMVYIPSSPFYLGSGGSEVSAFYKYPLTNLPFLISSESALTIAATDSSLYYTFSINGGDQTGTIPNNFPKGFKAFYCMKYEITQLEYITFLNKCDLNQATARQNIVGAFRNLISGLWPNYTTTAPYLPCNYLDWADIAAYLDWVALRPLTEMEFEKICRGSSFPTANEYAWGGTSITGATGISNSLLANETPSNSSANCSYNNNVNVQGPLRSGCFGGTFNTRTATGSSYYGIMELSGNLWERVISTGSAAGRLFTDNNGDGIIDSNGLCNEVTWPNSTAVGTGYRGGAWAGSGAPALRVSDRSKIEGGVNANLMGGRGVKTAQ